MTFAIRHAVGNTTMYGRPRPASPAGLGIFASSESAESDSDISDKSNPEVSEPGGESLPGEGLGWLNMTLVCRRVV